MLRSVERRRVGKIDIPGVKTALLMLRGDDEP